VWKDQHFMIRMGLTNGSDDCLIERLRQIDTSNFRA
jgi:hypothetical protein